MEMVRRMVSTDTVISFATDHGVWEKGERTWERVHPNHDSTKHKLVPTPGFRYLYRGQNARYRPCNASIMRGLPSLQSLSAMSVPDRNLLIRRLVNNEWFHAEVQKLPVFQWADEQHFYLDSTALAQHYGVKTGYLDLTQSFEVAMFFATSRTVKAELDPGKHDWYGEAVEAHQQRDGAAATGIIYRLDLQAMGNFPLGRMEAIGRIMFPRPHEQWAWTLELLMGEDFESMPGLEAIEFVHDRRLGDWVLGKCNQGRDLYPTDFLEIVAERIEESSVKREPVPIAHLTTLAEDIFSDQFGLPDLSVGRVITDFQSEYSNTSDEPRKLILDSEIQNEDTRWKARLPEVEADIVKSSSNYFRLTRT